MLLDVLQTRRLIGRFVLVGSDGVGINLDDLDGLEEAALGMLTLKAYSVEIEQFFDYFENLKPRTASPRNPWFNSMWAELFNCSWTRLVDGDNQSASCDDVMDRDVTEAEDYNRESTVSLTIDAVLVFAHAIDRARRERCPDRGGGKPARGCYTGELLLEYLRNTNYSGDNGDVR